MIYRSKIAHLDQITTKVHVLITTKIHILYVESNHGDLLITYLDLITTKVHVLYIESYYHNDLLMRSLQKFIYVLYVESYHANIYYIDHRSLTLMRSLPKSMYFMLRAVMMFYRSLTLMRSLPKSIYFILRVTMML